MKSCGAGALISLGTAIAIQIASEVSADDANILGALFNVIGDQLALIAATEVSNGNGNNCSKISEKNNSEDSNSKEQQSPAGNANGNNCDKATGEKHNKDNSKNSNSKKQQ